MHIDTQRFCFDCECGAHHDTPVQKILLHPGAIREALSLAEELGMDLSRAAAVYDTNTWQVVTDHPAVKHEVILPAEDLHATEAGVDLLRQALPECSFAFAIGGGTVHDLTRYICFERDIPFISVPTCCSVDGFVSYSCSMTLNGCKVTVPSRAPIGVVADTDILRTAPLYLALSGFGDLIGKYTAMCDWKAASLMGTARYCPTIANLQREALEVVCKTAPLLSQGEGEAFEALMYGLLLSGMAMQMYGAAHPASGAEHFLSHFWEMGGLGIRTQALHGEKVGVGTLLAIEAFQEIKEKGLAFFDEIDFSRTLVNDLEPVFGDSAPFLVKENTPDMCNPDSYKLMMEHKEEMLAAVCALPDYDELLALYTAIGAKRTMADLGIDESLKEKSLLYAPYVRNRISFLRLMGRR